MVRNSYTFITDQQFNLAHHFNQSCDDFSSRFMKKSDIAHIVEFACISQQSLNNKTSITDIWFIRTQFDNFFIFLQVSKIFFRFQFWLLDFIFIYVFRRRSTLSVYRFSNKNCHNMSRDIKTGSIRLRYRYFSGLLLKGYEVIEMFDSYNIFYIWIYGLFEIYLQIAS